jgi:hypothetical protein
MTKEYGPDLSSSSSAAQPVKLNQDQPQVLQSGSFGYLHGTKAAVIVATALLGHKRPQEPEHSPGNRGKQLCSLLWGRGGVAGG